ncbi:hypothetical protein [Tahibacter amnicola]|uniref:Uncharacterized protein n=1 Tax=Tahibacter amnicola TaxID=2976241 RepID=A0ABY6B6M2_9GAMM|nr:hypothetical protein [Tahibacter amnicola]UXI65781.1 hypothetical protein N4264_13505 [Tahibacter amnicola]
MNHGTDVPARGHRSAVDEASRQRCEDALPRDSMYTTAVTRWRRATRRRACRQRPTCIHQGEAIMAVRKTAQKRAPRKRSVRPVPQAFAAADTGGEDRLVTISVDIKGATSIALTVQQFDIATRALLPPATPLTLSQNKATFAAKKGKVYAVKYQFYGEKKASIELSAKTDKQRSADDPIAKHAHAKTAISSDLGFNLGYWQIPTKGEMP